MMSFMVYLKLAGMKYFLIIFSFFLLQSFSYSYGQTVVVLQASQDNTIYSDFTNNSNGAGENFTAGTIVNGSIRRALIRFNISSIPAGATITAVSLQMRMNRTQSAAIDISLHRLNTSWGEGLSMASSIADGQGATAQAGDVTWSCSFANGSGGCTSSWAPGGNFVATASASTAVNAIGTYTWSGSQMLADVQAWTNSAGSNYGWIIRSDEVITQSAKRFSSRTNPVIADRPTLTVTYNSLIPVTLLYFNAQATQYGNKLTWQTSQEINNDYFDIEHSRDGFHFLSVGKADGAGNTSVTTHYSFTHNGTAAGKHFYRLAQLDFDGRKTYSAIKLLEQKNRAKNIVISPNPVADKIFLQGVTVNNSLHKYVIMNAQGQKLAEKILTGNYISLPVSLLPGVYNLQVWQANGNKLSGTFIKQ